MSFAAIVLAAGRSSRMGPRNKLLEDLGGRPVVAHTVAHALASAASPVIVVTGHQEREVRATLPGAAVIFAANPEYASGMASSLKAGLTATPADAEGALVLLGDMPLIEAKLIDRVIAAATAAPHAIAIVPTVDGEWAHPVLLRRLLFAPVSALSGDAGARRLLQARADAATLALDDARCLVDADDADALARMRAAFNAQAAR